MKICMKCGNWEGDSPNCPYCNWKEKLASQRKGIREKIMKDLNPEEIEGYRIEILVPHSNTSTYILKETIPDIEVVREKYGMFARIGKVEALMRVEQHRRILRGDK